MGRSRNNSFGRNTNWNPNWSRPPNHSRPLISSTRRGLHLSKWANWRNPLPSGIHHHTCTTHKPASILAHKIYNRTFGLPHDAHGFRSVSALENNSVNNFDTILNNNI